MKRPFANSFELKISGINRVINNTSPVRKIVLTVVIKKLDLKILECWLDDWVDIFWMMELLIPREKNVVNIR